MTRRVSQVRVRVPTNMLSIGLQLSSVFVSSPSGAFQDGKRKKKVFFEIFEFLIFDFFLIFLISAQCLFCAEPLRRTPPLPDPPASDPWTQNFTLCLLVEFRWCF